MEGAKFCPACGASADSPGQGGGAAHYDAPRESQQQPDSWQRVSYQPPPAPAKRGLPVWGWVLIGCGAFLLLLFIGSMFLFVQGTKLIKENFGSIEELGAAGDVSLVQSAFAMYYDKNGKYGDFTAIRDANFLDTVTIKSISATELETETATFELELLEDGAKFRLTAKLKNGDKTWELDETSSNVMEDAFSGLFGGSTQEDGQ